MNTGLSDAIAAHPDSERASHYLYTHLSQQYGGVIFFDRTRAVEPLERTTAWYTGDAPETVRKLG